MNDSAGFSNIAFWSHRMPLRYVSVLLAYALLMLIFTGQVFAQDDKKYSAEPTGFRLTEYRTPVPRALKGAITLKTQALERLLKDKHPLLIDVLPKPNKPEGWPANQLWFPEPHLTIPSAFWLPEIGFGTINEAVEITFKQFMKTQTDDQLDAPVVLFCRENCWISWNAAKRLVGYGYTQIYWYPDGIDGWQDNMNETVVAEPQTL